MLSTSIKLHAPKPQAELHSVTRRITFIVTVTMTEPTTGSCHEMHVPEVHVNSEIESSEQSVWRVVHVFEPNFGNGPLYRHPQTPGRPPYVFLDVKILDQKTENLAETYGWIIIVSTETGEVRRAQVLSDHVINSCVTDPEDVIFNAPDRHVMPIRVKEQKLALASRIKHPMLL